MLKEIKIVRFILMKIILGKGNLKINGKDQADINIDRLHINKVSFSLNKGIFIFL